MAFSHTIGWIFTLRNVKWKSLFFYHNQTYVTIFEHNDFFLNHLIFERRGKMSSFGRYLNFSAQADKLRRLNKDGNKLTVRRYYKGYKRFLRYLSETTKMQRISDITDKELSDYVLYMKNRHYSPSTIKTDLASIRFWHSKIRNAKCELPKSNKFDFTNENIAESVTDNSDYV